MPAGSVGCQPSAVFSVTSAIGASLIAGAIQAASNVPRSAPCGTPKIPESTVPSPRSIQTAPASTLVKHSVNQQDVTKWWGLVAKKSPATVKLSQVEALGDTLPRMAPMTTSTSPVTTWSGQQQPLTPVLAAAALPVPSELKLDDRIAALGAPTPNGDDGGSDDGKSVTGSVVTLDSVFDLRADGQRSEGEDRLGLKNQSANWFFGQTRREIKLWKSADSEVVDHVSAMDKLLEDGAELIPEVEAGKDAPKLPRQTKRPWTRKRIVAEIIVAARAQFGFIPNASAADKIVVDEWMRRWCRNHGMCKVDIVKAMPYARELFWHPTQDDIIAGRLLHTKTHAKAARLHGSKPGFISRLFGAGSTTLDPASQ